MGERAQGNLFDPTCDPPASERPGYAWSRDPSDLALEVAASVMRRLRPIENRPIGNAMPAIRRALDVELTSALRRSALSGEG